MSSNHFVPAHDQKVEHSYIIHYPEHGPRSTDPHYADFEAYRAKRKANGTFTCDFATNHRGGDFSECSGEIECHHAHIEFALQNGVDIKLLEKDYPGVAEMTVGAWIETAPNLELLCEFHHRGNGGVHMLSQSDFAAEEYVRHLTVNGD